jgi:alpha-beta hydrolase superfamily lysophospholipase
MELFATTTGKSHVVDGSVPRLRDDEGPTVVSCCVQPEKYKGHILRSLKLHPTSLPKAVIIFIHGYFQHSRAVELHDLQQRALSEGFVWFGLDAPGHGLSGQTGDPTHPASPGQVPDMDAWIEDLYVFVIAVSSEESIRELPIVLMAHSWGTGCITLLIPKLQQHLGSRLRGICYSGCGTLPPELANEPPAIATAFIKCMACINPEALAFGREVALSESCRDPRWLQRCSDDQLRVQSSLRPWLALKNLLTTNPHGRSGALVPTLNIPMCICHGTADKAAPVYSSVHLYCHSATAFESKLLRLYAGAAHNLFADLKREELMSDWIRFAKDAVSQRTLASGSEDGGSTGGV